MLRAPSAQSPTRQARILQLHRQHILPGSGTALQRGNEAVGAHTVPRQDQTASGRQVHTGCSYPPPSCVVLNHHVPLKPTAQLMLEPGCALPLPRHLPAAKAAVGAVRMLHTARPCSSALRRASARSSPPSFREASAGTGSLAFCTYLASLFLLFYIIFMSCIGGYKEQAGSPRLHMPGGLPHAAGPRLPAAAPHAWGCALREAPLKPERAEAENHAALALSALLLQENPRQNCARGDQRFHGTSDACKRWRD